MNMEVFQLINNLAYKNKLLDNIMIFLSKDMIYIFAAALVIIFFIGIIKKNANTRFIAVNTALLTCINLILAYIIGVFYYIDRPFVHNKVNLLYPHAADASFPSDHATVTMSITLGAAKSSRALGIAMLVLTFIVGFSRIYVGHHTPLDIIGTYMLVLVVNYIYNRTLKNRIEFAYKRLENTIGKALGIAWLISEK